MSQAAPAPHDDLGLVRRALDGDVVAVESLVGRLGCVYRVLAQRNRRLGEPFAAEELEDLAQDVTIAVWSKLGEFRGLSSIEGWVFRFAHLELIYRLRARDRLPGPLGEERASAEPAHEDAAAAAHEEAEELYPALEQLEPAQGEVIRLKHFEDLTFPQIAERLGASANTAKTRYYRGMQRLREILGRGHRRLGGDVR
jgi:RNA polymerase sigma-70 factor (ECF subfamily)